jgi:probable DNA metabolism protein
MLKLPAVFRYDKTFEGLLSAVFDAYNRKEFPGHLLSYDEIEPLFAGQMHSVVTGADKSKRVWAGLTKKLSKNACNMLMCVWLSEAASSDELIFRYVCKTFDAPYSIETNFTDPDVLEVHQLAKKVSAERLHVIQFVRFQKSADGIFFAPVAPVYNALPLTIAHFKDRFSDQRWLVYDTKRKYGYYYDLTKVEEVTFDSDEGFLDGKLNDGQMASDEKLFQELWRSYFKSMTIKERLNLKLQRQHMPRRFWKYLTEKQNP